MYRERFVPAILDSGSLPLTNELKIMGYIRDCHKHLNPVPQLVGPRHVLAQFQLVNEEQ